MADLYSSSFVRKRVTYKYKPQQYLFGGKLHCKLSFIWKGSWHYALALSDLSVWVQRTKNNLGGRYTAKVWDNDGCQQMDGFFKRDKFNSFLLKSLNSFECVHHPSHSLVNFQVVCSMCIGDTWQLKVNWLFIVNQPGMLNLRQFSSFMPYSRESFPKRGFETYHSLWMSEL